MNMTLPVIRDDMSERERAAAILLGWATAEVAPPHACALMCARFTHGCEVCQPDP